MAMTHYMELLAVNQPWNLILFMAIPVILAETVAITELFILFNRQGGNMLRLINKTAGIVGGVYFLGVFLYLLQSAVIPLTLSGQWRGPADVIAVGFYLAGVIPLVGMALLDLNIIGKQRDENGKLKLHATFVAIFLVVAHVAMIFGMLDPNLLMGAPSSQAMPQHSMH
ncbi:permease [Heliobacterium gestii]|uniref:Permease n=1 Tax=Heliomicrobium gestii TaxID=2699 RepID=A0A845LP01_HELGE|nr:DUF6803 family protein [Heliomicrobium gestii]MBM7868465.1 hypothetical protein [Heliomicrobium gestii]MZP44606.1 permease [Heliomicrobium gestii]